MTGARFLAWVAERPIAAVPLILIAIAERVGWTLAGHMAMLDTELRNVATTWAQTGWVADAFRAGSGPTAHVGALPAVISGVVVRAFGTDTPATVLTLTALSGLVVVATALILNRVFARFGTPAVIRGVAMVLICALPLHLELEARSLRVYENGTAALLVALMLLAVVRLDAAKSVDLSDMLGLSVLAALMIALSPIIGVTGVAMLAILALRRMDWRERFRAMSILGVVLAATMLPWALRNHSVLGEMVWTRGNFGLEFALGMHPAAVDPIDPAATYLARLAEIHPYGSDPAYRAMQAAGGELSYARQLGDRTWGWVAAHPGQAGWIAARHLREFYFPPPWLWHHTAQPDATTAWRIIGVNLIAALALVGLIAGLIRRQWQFVYLLPPIVLLPLPYLLTQPLVRYRYAIASLLVFMAADYLARLTGRGQRVLKHHD